ncbi:hypothetical protein ACRTEC_00680 [Janibacter indicus]
MSSPRYVGRHGSRRPSPLSRLGSLPSSVGSHGARTVAKSVAGVGIVLGSGAFVIAPSQAEGNPAPVADSVASAQASVEDLFSDRTGDGSASRSSARVAAAITAPDGKQAADVHDGAGALAVEPVVKPKPKPKPTPKPEAVEQTEEETEAPAQQEQEPADEQEQTVEAPQAESTTSSTTAAAPATDNYASQAAALGLGANAQKVYSAVRTQFPDMTNIGGYRAGDPGDHGSGNAVDIMVTGARGDQVAAWLQSNAGSLNIKYVIWQQRIWMPGGSWKPMEDRGDPTQNHFDHVHVSVN